MKKYWKIIIIAVSIIVFFALLLLIYFKVTFIGKDDVKKIVIDNMNVSSSDVFFESIELEPDKNYYEVEVYYKNKDYEYKIDAKEGKIIYTDFQSYNSDNNTNNNGNGNDNSNGNGNNNTNNTKISLQEARNIALEHANLDISVVNIVKCESEYDDGILIHEIEFIYNNYEYDYKIDSRTGEIISFDKDSIYN